VTVDAQEADDVGECEDVVVVRRFHALPVAVRVRGRKGIRRAWNINLHGS
jgi:hypothetical protein